MIGAFYLFLGRSFETSEEKDLGHLVRISKSAEGTANPVTIEVNGDKLKYTKNGEVYKASKESGTSVYEIMSASDVDPSAYSVVFKNGGSVGTIFSILIGLLPFILCLFPFFYNEVSSRLRKQCNEFWKKSSKNVCWNKSECDFF